MLARDGVHLGRHLIGRWAPVRLIGKSLAHPPSTTAHQIRNIRSFA